MQNTLIEDKTNDGAQTLYLDALKRSLTDSIYWDDPLSTYTFVDSNVCDAAWKRAAASVAQSLLKPFKMRLVKPYSTPIQDYSRISKDEIRNNMQIGKGWPLRAHTMIGMMRLDNLQHCVETVIKEDVPGDLIETGVWRGGACILMRAILKAYGDTSRTVWLADSFSGLPRPNAALYPADSKDKHYTYRDFLAVSRSEVEDNFRRYDLFDDQVAFLEGWFKDTLPSAPIDRLAVLRLDGDMYESTIQALDALYEKVSPGGFVIVDDYFLKGCREAVTDFRSANRINDAIVDIDGRGAFWRKAPYVA